MHIAASPMPLHPVAGNDPARIDKVSRQLEGQFAQMLIKSMRDASFGDSLFPEQNQLFRDMYDQRIAEAMTQGRGLGLSAVIARQLGGGEQGGPALDNSLSPAKAARAYKLAAPAAAPMALPGSAPAAATDMLQGLGETRIPAAAQDQALDLIAGRETGQLHAALGGRAPAMEVDADTASVNWAVANDRWSGVAAPAAAGATAPVDLANARAVASQFGTHTPEGFVASIWPHAQQAARELGVSPRALVAQAALETGWGRHGIKHGNGSNSNNLFGIKATGWKGDSVATNTHEYVNGQRRTERANFRAYASAAESFGDYVRLLKNNPRYQNALKAGTDVHGFARGLQQAGYATDPHYAAKIASIASGPAIDRAVAAISQAGTRLGQTFASATGLSATTLR